MSTTDSHNTSHGTIAVTDTDPYDLPEVARMVPENSEHVSVWEIAVPVGHPGSYVYDPVPISLDSDNGAWLWGVGESKLRPKQNEMYVMWQGELGRLDYESISSILRKVVSR